LFGQAGDHLALVREENDTEGGFGEPFGEYQAGCDSEVAGDDCVVADRLLFGVSGIRHLPRCEAE
jgi:hypothetical protein